MTEPLDVEYVELRARGEDDAVRDIAKALRQIAVEIKKTAKAIETDVKQAFDDAADSAQRDVNAITRTVEREATQQKRAARGVGEAIASDIAVGAQVAQAEVDDMADHVVRDLKRIEREAHDAGRSIATGIGVGSAVGSTFGELFSWLAKIGVQLRAISSLLPSPLIAALVAATPAIAALAGSLLDLGGILLTLPAGIAVLAAAITPLIMSFSGLGTAIEALASGDLKKIDEAFKNLAPSARAFAVEINKLRGPLRELRKEVQESFFAQLRGDITAMTTAALPTLRTGLSQVAASLGRFGSQLAELLGEQDILEVLGDIFESTARIISGLAPHITDLLGIFFGVIERGLPFIERMAAALGRGMDALGSFLSETLKTGSFENFVEGAFTVLKDLGDLTFAVGRLLGAMFGNLGDEGHSFLQTLTSLVDEMTAFFESAEGQSLIQDLVDALPVLVQSLRTGLVTLAILAVSAHNTREALAFLGGVIFEVGKAVGDFFVSVWNEAGDAISVAGDAISRAYTAVSGFFSGVGTKIAEFGSSALAFFQALPGRILGFLQALPGQVQALFTQMLDNLLYNVGFTLGKIAQFFHDFPTNAYNGIVKIKDLVARVFVEMWDFAVTRTRDNFHTIGQFFSDLPGRAYSGLVGIIGRVRSIFTATRDGTVSTVRDMISAVGRFFDALPGRVAGALTSFRNGVFNALRSIASGAYTLGRNIISGIVDGIRDLIQWAVDWAKYAARRILQGAQDAIHIGSPSRDARDKVGKPLMQGIGVGIDDETPNVVDTIQRALKFTVDVAHRAATGSNSGGDAVGGAITFGPGSVQVIFQGAVPTEQEAQRTGTAVGSSIAQALARRAVRTAVRTA